MLLQYSPLSIRLLLATIMPLLRTFPFFIAGGMKIEYDLCLYRAFVSYESGSEA